MTKQDFTRLTWSDKSSSAGTQGCFLKTYENDGIRRIYYKLSNYDRYRGFFGHESVNELVASRLLDVLGFDHVEYRLIHADVCVDNALHDTWICSSKNFRKRGEKKLAMDAFYDIEALPEESPLDLCKRMGWDTQIYQMMLVDFLIANRDRHGANIEVLVNSHGEYRLSPLFDHGVSFLFSTYGDEKAVQNFDVMNDMPVNNYFGCRSLFTNLELIPRDLAVNPILSEDYKYIFRGVEQVISPALVRKMQEMIEWRWNFFEEIRNR